MLFKKKNLAYPTVVFPRGPKQHRPRLGHSSRPENIFLHSDGRGLALGSFSQCFSSFVWVKSRGCNGDLMGGYYTHTYIYIFGWWFGTFFLP